MKAIFALLFVLVSSAAFAATPMAGTGPCTRHTPVGVYCFCNHGVYRGSYLPGWIADPMVQQHYTRPGWHVSAIKGMHGGGKLCIRDRAPTAEEREQARGASR